jgi:uncharacterized protein YeaC (DUF1315 family)
MVASRAKGRSHFLVVACININRSPRGVALHVEVIGNSQLQLEMRWNLRSRVPASTSTILVIIFNSLTI